MVQFATPEHQKGGKKKPKKELGAWMDIVQVVAPIAASVVGTPLAGAAVSALLEGTESKLEGGSWKEALTKGALSGGVSAATAGLAPGADKVAGEATKQLGKGVVEQAGKQALKETAKGATKEGAKQFGLGLATGAAGDLAKDTAMSRAMSSIADEGAKRFSEQMAATAAGAGMTEAMKGAGEAGAKQKFFDHVQNLGEMGLGMYSEMQAGAAQRAQQGALQNQALMQRIQNAMQGQYQPTRSRYYKPYGG